MVYLVLAIIIYEMFLGLLTEFIKQGISSKIYEQSALERKIFSKGSNLDLIFSTFGTIARINGIIFLIYLGYKTTWWHPIVIWVLGLLFIILASIFCRGKTGFTIPAFGAFLILPLAALYLWFSV